MFCKNCGKELENGRSVCDNCGTPCVNNETTNYQTTVNQKSNMKIYKILSYIGILWLVGLLSISAKEDPSVRFHVGQGIIATIFIVILNIVVKLIENLVIANIFTNTFLGVSVINSTGLALIGFLDFAVAAISVALEIIGVINASKGEDKELPVIGSHAFYR